MEKQGKLYQDRIFWITLAGAAFFLLPTLWFRFSADQALADYGAWVWKNYHLPPYLGVWDCHFPGMFILHRAVISILGESIFRFRLFDFMVQLSAAAFIYSLTKNLSGSRPAGFLAGVFYGIFYAILGSEETGLAEGYVLWILLASTSLGIRFANRARLRSILVGLTLGLAVWFDPAYIFCWLVFGAWFWMEGRKERPKRIFLESTLFGIGALLAPALLIFYYGHLGHLRDLYQATVIYHLSVDRGSAADLPYPSGLGLIFYILHKDYLRQSLIIFSGLLTIWFGLVSPQAFPNKKLFRTLASLILISAIGYRVQAEYFPSQLIPLIGLMTVFSGAGLGWIAAQLRGPGTSLRGKIISGSFYLCLFLIMIPGINSQLINYFAFDSFWPLDQVYSSGSSPDARYYQLTESLTAALGKEPGMEYFGGNPLLPDLLKRKLPSRFCNVALLLARNKNGELSDPQKRWIREYTDSVIQAKPKIFLVEDQFPDWKRYHLPGPGLKTELAEQFPELEKFLRENYRLYLNDSLLEVYVYFGK